MNGMILKQRKERKSKGKGDARRGCFQGDCALQPQGEKGDLSLVPRAKGASQVSFFYFLFFPSLRLAAS